MEFVIPVSRADLLSATVASYTVNEVVSTRHLAGKVQGLSFITRLSPIYIRALINNTHFHLECQRVLVREGQLGVLSYFDVLFSVLQ